MTRARILADYVSSGDELADKAPLASPAFTGTPTGITGTHITSGTLGNTVQDNITRLGTVTSGNLSNSAIVYPAGHVLQVITEIKNDEASAGLSGGSFTKVVDSSGNAEWKVTITGVLASSYVYLIWSGVTSTSRTGSEAAGGFGFFREASALTSSNGYDFFIQANGTTYLHIQGRSCLTFMDTSPATGTNNYYLGYASGSGSSAGIKSQSGYPPSVFTAMEIAQ